MLDSAALDALQIDRTRGNHFLMQTLQQRLDIHLNVIGIFKG
jgi:hypothetical protein